MPVYRHAFAAKRQMASFEHRMAMARLAFEALPDAMGRVRVIDVERRVQRTLRRRDPDAVPGTIDIVRHLMKANPRTEFALLLGADTYRDLLDGRWRESEALLGLVTVVALPRKGSKTDVPLRKGVPQLERVSSSAVRRDFAKRGHMLQPEVRDYIEVHALYGVAEGRRTKSRSSRVPAYAG